MVIHPKFCTKCGQRIQKDLKGIKYNANTGAIIRMRETVYCPSNFDNTENHYYKRKEYDI